ncbi:DNA polymerase alpha/epsilon subunit B-domain-containing protein [Dunaliella salina]|uniref:DNA polymerase alpha/epsilon subunit B-domain-containing protein n=1 Tax=Dunaliella salina TaxID=3046 RepID=A0ABQ7GEJ6_DUNSA|nr:DNA polymerase alpha/epsilon subunit B-domain-containing protein [Dunaliella salina]|eukprot:KAF5833035.1 DNA polymerase alpha/epsilon subunit B-domain-containing protein [Dunaliella salina]
MAKVETCMTILAAFTTQYADSGTCGHCHVMENGAMMNCPPWILGDKPRKHGCFFSPSSSAYGSLVRASKPHDFDLGGQSFLGSRCLFPSSSAYGSFVRASNPHAFDLDGVSFLGTSGQPVDDVVKYSRQNNRLDVMEQCLHWRHLAPTAPDTLASYPFDAFDPFIIQSTPHVLFAGDQPEFGVRTVQGPNGQSVLLLALPSFEHTGTIVLLNLRTMATHPITFGAEM